MKANFKLKPVDLVQLKPGDRHASNNKQWIFSMEGVTELSVNNIFVKLYAILLSGKASKSSLIFIYRTILMQCYTINS